MKSVREKIEEGIVQAVSSQLKASENPTTGYLGFVGDYNGEFEGETLEDLHRRIGGSFPAVLVEAGSGTLSAESVTKRRFTRRIEVDVYVCANNLRSRESRLRNDAAFDAAASLDPGIFTTIELIHDLVAGNDFDIDGVGPAMPVREAPLIKATNVTVWHLSYEFETDANVAPWDDGNGQLLTSYFLKSQQSDHPSDDAPNPIVTTEGTFL